MIPHQFADYVKFIRGTPSAYEALRIKDPNTLYYIFERESDTGVLYLGERIISQGGASSLRQLSDVLLTQNINPNSLLVYENDKWVNKTANEVISLIISPFIGATDLNPGAAGLVPQPFAGDNYKFLKGNGNWETIDTISNAEIQRILDS